MDNVPGGRSSKFARAFRESFAGLMAGINTAIPGRVLSFDPATQLAEVQSSIMIKGDSGDVVAPPIIGVPVHFSGGNAFHIEHQIDPGDEGLIVFSQRCIDSWIDQGGDAQQTIVRTFDAGDALFIPGFRSNPKKISGFENNGVRIRNKSGSSHIWLKNDGTAEISVTDLTVNGNITSTGTITAPTVDATSALTSAGKNITTHTHPAGNPPGNTGPNT